MKCPECGEDMIKVKGRYLCLPCGYDDDPDVDEK